MKRRLAALALALALLLPGCGKRQAQTAPDVSAADALAAMLAAAPEGAEGPEIVSDERMPACLALYGVDAAQVVQCAAARLGGARVFELAVFRAADADGADAMAEALTEYARQRWADFGGYAPEQAAIADDARILRHGDTWAVLILSADPEAVSAAFLTFMEQGPVPSPSQTASPAVTPSPAQEPDPSPVSPQPEPVPSPSPEPSQEPAPSQEPQPSQSPAVRYPEGWQPFVSPGIDDMTEYDTSAILAAWRTGEADELSDYDRAILDRASQLLEDLLREGMSDYEKELAVYRWMVRNVAYDYDHYDNFAQLSPDSSTPYGPLLKGKGICLGYAVTFQLLMDMAGVECITVIGAANASREDHAWNMVRLNGNWYCTDVTWDAGSGPNALYYFNITSDALAQRDHQWDYASVPLADTPGRGME